MSTFLRQRYCSILTPFSFPYDRVRHFFSWNVRDSRYLLWNINYPSSVRVFSSRSVSLVTFLEYYIDTRIFQGVYNSHSFLLTFSSVHAIQDISLQFTWNSEDKFPGGRNGTATAFESRKWRLEKVIGGRANQPMFTLLWWKVGMRGNADSGHRFRHSGKERAPTQTH